MPFRLFAQGWLPTIQGSSLRFGLYRDDRRDDEYLLALDEQGHFRLACGPIEPEVWGEHHHSRGVIHNEALLEEGLSWVAYDIGPARNGHIPAWTQVGWYKPAEQRGIRAYVSESFTGRLRRRRRHVAFSADEDREEGEGRERNSEGRAEAGGGE